MRRRLITSTLAVVLVVIAVLGVPLAIIVAQSIESHARAQLAGVASGLSSSLEFRMQAGAQISSDLISDSLPPLHSPAIYVEVRNGLSGAVIATYGQPIVGPVIPASAPGPTGAIVNVFEPRAPVARDIFGKLLLIGAMALFAVITAVLMAILQARRLARPLVGLADAAEALGGGDPRPRHRRYGVPELDRVAEVLDSSAERVARMLTAERRLAADASHQLRTPLAALSMRLEEIIETDDAITVKEEATIALTQVERLTDVVQSLLTNARDPRTASAVPVQVDHVLAQQVDEWRPAFANAGRRIAVAGSRGLCALATPGALAHVVATLLENSLAHGAGMVTVRTRMTGSSVVVEVTDEGPGVPDELGLRVFERSVSGQGSTGLGLAVARELAEADGGRLELLHKRPPVFAVFLTASVAR